jgi:hypothetical protein
VRARGSAGGSPEFGHAGVQWTVRWRRLGGSELTAAAWGGAPGVPAGVGEELPAYPLVVRRAQEGELAAAVLLAAEKVRGRRPPTSSSQQREPTYW